MTKQKTITSIALSLIMGCYSANGEPVGGCVDCVEEESDMLFSLENAGFHWHGVIVWGADLPAGSFVVQSDDCQTLWVEELDVCKTEAWWWIAACASGDDWGTDAGYHAVDSAYWDVCE